MRSFSRNSCKSYRTLGLAAAISLLLGTAAQAADPAHFVFTAYSNGAGGAQLIDGDYPAAVSSLRHAGSITLSDESAAANNRCVALSMTKQWDAARIACDRAVHTAQQEVSLAPSYQTWTLRRRNEYVAIALSNRAVLHWLASDSEAAAGDLNRAERVSPRADFVARNQAALEYSKTAVAQVAVAPSGH
jgi:tetratricopeptide (TPR) repeat protein